MANAKQLALLKSDVDAWNKWRHKNRKKKERVDLQRAMLNRADLQGADLHNASIQEANLSEANLIKANLSSANLRGASLRNSYLQRSNLNNAILINTYFQRAILNGADLHEANLYKAILRRADLSPDWSPFKKTVLSKTNLQAADLRDADLSFADLRRADLTRADLSRANLSNADLSEANLSEANLSSSVLIGTKVTDTKLCNSRVYGISAWDLEGEFREQKDLIITPAKASAVTVDNIEIAQFVYLILNNKKIRDVINTLTSKTVLILGRFAIPERKQTLDSLREKLRQYDLLPIVFDFDRPTDKDFTETIRTLASISYFVIADVTNPKSSPLELQATIPDYQIPFVPIIQEGESPFAMMVDLQKKYNWVLDTISYDSLDTLIDILKPHIIDPAIQKRDELRLIKAKEPTIISGRELKEKKSKGKP